MVYDITRRSTYNHLSSWLTDARNLTNPNTVRLGFTNRGFHETMASWLGGRLHFATKHST